MKKAVNFEDIKPHATYFDSGRKELVVVDKDNEYVKFYYKSDYEMHKMHGGRKFFYHKTHKFWVKNWSKNA